MATKQITSVEKIKAKMAEINDLENKLSYLKNGVATVVLQMKIVFSEDCAECGQAQQNIFDSRKELDQLTGDIVLLTEALKAMRSALDPANSFLNKDY